MENRQLGAGLLCVAIFAGHGCTAVANPQLVTDADTSSEDPTTSGDGDGDPGDGDGDPATTDGDPTDFPQGSCDVWLQDCP